MIAKIINSNSGFSASLDYVMNRDHANIIHSENIRLGDSKFIALQLKTLAKCNDRINNPLGHIVLSFSKDLKHKLSDSMMRMVAQDYLLRMGVKNTAIVVVRHEDRKHPHCHIIYSKNSLGNKKINESYIKLNSLRAVRAINLKYGFKQQNHNSPFTDSKNLFYQAKKEMSYYVRQAVHGNNPCKSWDELKSYLAIKGISVEFKTKGNTNEVQGVSFGKGEFKFRGSELGRDLSFAKIDRIFEQAIKIDGAFNPSSQSMQMDTDLQNRSQNDSLLNIPILPFSSAESQEDDNIKKRKRKIKF